MREMLTTYNSRICLPIQQLGEGQVVVIATVYLGGWRRRRNNDEKYLIKKKKQSLLLNCIQKLKKNPALMD